MSPLAGIDCGSIPLLHDSRSPWDSARWAGSAGDAVLFEARKDESVVWIAAGFFVRKEESDVWKACQDMLAEAVRMAAGWLQGLYGLEMIAMELERGIQNFRLGDFGELLANHARVMTVGEARLIRYGGFWGVFKKRVPESYGRIEFKSCVKINRQEPSRLDLYVKALAREAGRALPPQSSMTLKVCDLSAARVYDPADALQQAKLQELSKKMGPVYYRHQREEICLWETTPAAGM